ncbi:hypothetical protein FISHEDRAFT_67240 [Fistulina hepatica ATCC 64428]|uniref:tRNA-splicing endonuclease subunit Sen15 domain-containing protein n=1 Tax=Fistulina hepatica ATCC 64428 TaxID=1128425 RepID=A0A0D7A3P1_9AGAR|nr:hypothetical protein FISHEDRAFT_67240 [Fistulina hepatica ATCC 64428]
MESHASFQALASYLKKYARSSDSLFQTYNDLLYTQKWLDLEVIDFPVCSRCIIKGRNPVTKSIMHVMPCSLAEVVSYSWIKDAFPALGNPEEIYLAITDDDSSLVYYKISQGIVKPPM